jgi:hypothetical protein
MKLHAITPIALALVLVMAGSAAATHFGSFTGGADCNGFWATGYVYFAKPTPSVEIFYEVNLMQGTTTVKTASGSFMVYATARDFNFTEAWGEELCGDYTVDGRFWFFDTYGNDTGYITAAFTCECQEEDGCHFTPGYWKNHPDAWPVTTLSLGGISYGQAQLLDILDQPVRRDPTIILAHHLIAAKLNVLNGASDSINDEIAAADNLLMMYPLFSAPSGSAKDAIIAVKNDLCAYNEAIMPGCEGYIAPTFDRILQAPPAGERSTWGDIKNIYK